MDTKEQFLEAVFTASVEVDSRDSETVTEECLFLRKMEMFRRFLLIKKDRERAFLEI